MSIVPFNSSSTSINYPGLIRGALRGYRNMQMDRYAQRMLPVGVSDIQGAQLRTLARRVNRISPAVESITAARSLSSGTGTNYDDYSLSGGLPTNTEFAAKYIGDKFRNLKLRLRFECSEVINKIRVIVYIPKKVEDGMTTSNMDFVQLPDATKYTVLYDTIAFPQHGNQSRRNFIIANVPLKNRITTIDRTGLSAGSVKSNEIRVFTLIQHSNASAQGVSQWYQLMFQNK